MEVTSNIWGTKFKLHGVASFLPEDVGHVLYKTSLLHLQPRQVRNPKFRKVLLFILKYVFVVAKQAVPRTC